MDTVKVDDLVIRPSDYRGVDVIEDGSNPVLVEMAMRDAIKRNTKEREPMREIIIRENQYEGLKALDDWDGPMTLWMILREAFEGVPFDETGDDKKAWWNPNGRGPKAIHAAIAPEIIDSMTTDDEPRELVEAIISAITAPEEEPED